MKLGLERERAGDADALALAAGELVRVAVGASAGRPTTLEQLGTRARACVAGASAVDAQRLGDDVADGHARVERRVRVLEDHLHPPAQRAQLRASRASVMSCAVERRSRPRSAREPQDRAAERGLAAALLADQAERLAALDREA